MGSSITAKRRLTARNSFGILMAIRRRQRPVKKIRHPGYPSRVGQTIDLENVCQARTKDGGRCPRPAAIQLGAQGFCRQHAYAGARSGGHSPPIHASDGEPAPQERATTHLAGITKTGRPILTLKDWLNYAGPKSRAQWKDDRSAKELARCWLAVASPQLPPEIAALLRNHPDFGPVGAWTAEPESRLPFDTLGGEPRNTDLLVEANDQHGEYLIAVEAKADEPFGETVAETMAAALERKLSNSGSNGLARVEQLTGALFVPGQKADPPLGILRYQLLTATAGALHAGKRRRPGRVVLMVQEFHTRKTTAKKHRANAHDLNRFITRLTLGEVSTVTPGRLYGPIVPHGRPLLVAPPHLYIALAVHHVR